MPLAPSNDLQDDVVFNQRATFVNHKILKQVHQEIKFILRALPVFTRETIKSQLLYAQPTAFFGNGPNRVSTLLMPAHAGQGLPLGPAPVAVHDDRNMLGPTVSWHLQMWFCLWCRWGSHRLVAQNPGYRTANSRWQSDDASCLLIQADLLTSALDNELL